MIVFSVYQAVQSKLCDKLSYGGVLFQFKRRLTSAIGRPDRGRGNGAECVRGVSQVGATNLPGLKQSIMALLLATVAAKPTFIMKSAGSCSCSLASRRHWVHMQS